MGNKHHRDVSRVFYALLLTYKIVFRLVGFVSELILLASNLFQSTKLFNYWLLSSSLLPIIVVLITSLIINKDFKLPVLLMSLGTIISIQALSVWLALAYRRLAKLNEMNDDRQIEKLDLMSTGMYLFT